MDTRWPLQDCWYHQSLDAEKAFSGESLNADIRTGVVIIGAGFAGLATAIGLVERGYRDVTVLEAQRVGYGASGRNGGFIMAGYSLPERQLIRQLGGEAARQLYQMTLAAQCRIKQRIARYDIDCELVDEGIVLADWFSDEQALRRQQAFMNEEVGAAWEYLSPEQLRDYTDSPRYGGGLLEPEGAHFHPLKYLHGLAAEVTAAGVNVYEHSPARSIQPQDTGWQVTLDNGCRINAEQVVVCAGGYIHGLQLPAARAVLPIATYVMVTESLGTALDDCLPGVAAVYDTRFAFDYYRRLPGQRLLWGGRIAAGRPSRQRIERLLRKDLRRVFPALADAEVTSAWGGLMGYTRPQMPSINQSRPGLWHALGFGGHGVCPTTIAGELLAEAISGQGCDYLKFEPFGLPPAYGWLGLAGAQGYYWWRQWRDYLRM